MTQVTVDSSLIKEAIASLDSKDQELQKLAAIELELEVTQEVIKLASEGHISVSDIPEKVQEFCQDPESLLIFKKATELRPFSTSLGSAMSSSESMAKTASGVNAEARLHTNIFDILNS